MEERKLDHIEFIIRGVQATAICTFKTEGERDAFVEFCAKSVPQFKIRLSADGTSMIYDPNLCTVITRFEKEQPDFEALLRQMD